MLEKKFLHFLVNCPGKPFCTEKMQITLVNMNGKWLPAQCDGCSSVNGTMPCEYCVESIAKKFMKNPDMDLSKPITP